MRTRHLLMRCATLVLAVMIAVDFGSDLWLAGTRDGRSWDRLTASGAFAWLVLGLWCAAYGDDPEPRPPPCE